MKQAVMVNIKASPIPTGLWALSGRYGFHPSNTDAVGNEKTAVGFEARILELVESLRHDIRPDRTWRSLEQILQKEDRKPLSREREMEVSRVNELTLVWACFLHKLGYYGLARDEALCRLKGEVVWLVQKFGYKMPPMLAMVCPLLSKWDGFSIWKVVLANDKSSTGKDPVSNGEIPSYTSCEECPAMVSITKAAR